MKTWWMRFLKQIWTNEAYFVGRVRAVIMVVALNGAIFGKELADTWGRPEWERRIKVLAVLASGASLLLTAGDKNPKSYTETALGSAPPRGFTTLRLLAIFAVSFAVLAGLWTWNRHRLVEALRAAEAATLKLKGQIVADVDTAKELQTTVAGLLEQNELLREAYEQAVKDAPGAKLESSAKLSTGPVVAHGKSRGSGGTPLPQTASAASPVVSNPPPEPGGHSGEGSPAEGGLKFDQTTFAPGCLLAEGDKAELRVALLQLHTERDNRVVVGQASVWRIEPAPETVLLAGKFSAPLSDVDVLKPASAASGVGWGVAALGLCGTRGCAPGVSLMAPPLKLLLRWEAAVGVVTGPIEPGILLSLGARL
jgi:hypothetical protein